MIRLADRLTIVNAMAGCLVLCAVSLFVADAVGPVHAGLLVLIAAWQRWRWSGGGGRPDARRLLWEICSLLALLFFVADLFLVTRNLIGAALRLLLYIVAYHADNPQPPHRARQTLGLTLIQMIAASASTTEVGFSILMAIYLVLFLWTLAALGIASSETAAPSLPPAAPARGLRIPLARVTAAVTPAVLLVGLGIFFVIPHYGTGYFREQGRSIQRNLTGFSDRIELGSIGSIKKSHATVMRVRRDGREEPPPLPLRMRGIALDRYDGRTWRVSDSSTWALRPDRRNAYLVDPTWPYGARAQSDYPAGQPLEDLSPEDWMTLVIVLEPLQTRVLFTPPEVVSVTLTRFLWTLYTDRLGSLHAGGFTSRRFPYRTVSRTRPLAREDQGAAPPGGAAIYLQLPDLDPRVIDLARRVVDGIQGAEARARALESHLLMTYSYTLDVNDAAVASPLTHFLIERRPGHCEYFATAMAVMLRVAGIPSRVVNGFNGGEYSELTGHAIIRQSDAHSWVEAWIPERGWTTFDPTPPDLSGGSFSLAFGWRRLLDEIEIAWDTYIVGLDLDDQENALEEVRDRFEWGLSGAVIRVREILSGLRNFLAGPASVAFKGLMIAGGAALLVFLLMALHSLGRSWRRWRQGSAEPHPATTLFRSFEAAMARSGLRRAPYVSAAAFARDAGAPEIAEAFDAARFGPAPLSEAALEDLRRELAER